MARTPKLAATNGTRIEVKGEAILEFRQSEKKCEMSSLDADVKKPLGAVSAMNDGGKAVVFSNKYGHYIENDVTGERIPMMREGDAFLMELRVDDDAGSKNTKAAEWVTRGAGRYERLDVDGMSDGGSNREKVVCRSLTLP